MNDVEKIFHEDMMRQTFSEVVSDDDNYDFIDSLCDGDSDHSAESEEI